MIPKVKFLIICVLVLGFALMPITLATEYEGDGTYRLLVGDSIKASNGYIVKLAFAGGAMDSRSDWWTILEIYNPQGELVNFTGGWGNYTDENVDGGPIETETLYIYIERYVAEEAVITVISKNEMVTPEFPHAFSMLLVALPTTIILAGLIKRCRKPE